MADEQYQEIKLRAWKGIDEYLDPDDTNFPPDCLPASSNVQGFRRYLEPRPYFSHIETGLISAPLRGLFNYVDTEGREYLIAIGAYNTAKTQCAALGIKQVQYIAPIPSLVDFNVMALPTDPNMCVRRRLTAAKYRGKLWMTDGVYFFSTDGTQIEIFQDLEQPDWVSYTTRGATQIVEFAGRFFGADTFQRRNMLVWTGIGESPSKIDSWRVPSTAIVRVSTEILGLGDGSKKTFTGTLKRHPVSPTTLVVIGQIAYNPATFETFTDNGAGVLTGNNGGSGTIEYDTGDYSVTFGTSAPLAGLPVWANYDYTGVAFDGGFNTIGEDGNVILRLFVVYNKLFIFCTQGIFTVSNETDFPVTQVSTVEIINGFTVALVKDFFWFRGRSPSGDGIYLWAGAEEPKLSSKQLSTTLPTMRMAEEGGRAMKTWRTQYDWLYLCDVIPRGLSAMAPIIDEDYISFPNTTLGSRGGTVTLISPIKGDNISRWEWWFVKLLYSTSASSYATFSYRTGATSALCLAASWTTPYQIPSAADCDLLGVATEIGRLMNGAAESGLWVQWQIDIPDQLDADKIIINRVNLTYVQGLDYMANPTGFGYDNKYHLVGTVTGAINRSKCVVTGGEGWWPFEDLDANCVALFAGVGQAKKRPFWGKRPGPPIFPAPPAAPLGCYVEPVEMGPDAVFASSVDLPACDFGTTELNKKMRYLTIDYTDIAAGYIEIHFKESNIYDPILLGDNTWQIALTGDGNRHYKVFDLPVKSAFEKVIFRPKLTINGLAKIWGVWMTAQLQPFRPTATLNDLEIKP